MPSLTDGAIRHAMKRVEKSGKQVTLTDGEGRGTGRLVLVLKPMPTRVTADWMAQQWRDGKRTKTKLGSYPSMSLAEAREVFKRDFADVIQKGRSIKIAGDTRPGTVADLFEAYVAVTLKEDGKPSWKEAEKGLNKIADTLGPQSARPRHRARRNRRTHPAHLRARQALHGRSRPQLHPLRLQLGHEVGARLPQHLAAALQPRLQSRRRHTHRAQEGRHPLARRGRVRSALPVARMSRRACTSALHTRRANPHADRPARRRNRAPPCRSVGRKERIIDWSKTKNGKPHAIPVPDRSPPS